MLKQSRLFKKKACGLVAWQRGSLTDPLQSHGGLVSLGSGRHSSCTAACGGTVLTVPLSPLLHPSSHTLTAALRLVDLGSLSRGSVLSVHAFQAGCELSGNILRQYTSVIRSLNTTQVK